MDTFAGISGGVIKMKVLFVIAAECEEDEIIGVKEEISAVMDCEINIIEVISEDDPKYKKLRWDNL